RFVRGSVACSAKAGSKRWTAPAWTWRSTRSSSTATHRARSRSRAASAKRQSKPDTRSGPWRADSEVDFHRSRTALRLAVIDGLDVVAVGIEDEGGVVAGMVWARTGAAVVGAAAGERGPVEGVDHRRIPGLEREVMAPRENAAGGNAIRRRDEKLVGPEVALSGAPDGDAEDIEHGLVEAPAGVQVAHNEL